MSGRTPNKVITAEQLSEAVKKANERWSKRYPNYELELVRYYTVTRYEAGRIIKVGSYREDQLPQRSYPVCLSEMSYSIAIKNGKDRSTYNMLHIGSTDNKLWRNSRNFKKFWSRALSVLVAELGIAFGKLGQTKIYDRFDVVGPYQTDFREDGYVYKISYADGSTQKISRIDDFFKRGNFIKNPIIESTSVTAYRHILKSSWFTENP